jgi:hypothetical protein
MSPPFGRADAQQRWLQRDADSAEQLADSPGSVLLGSLNVWQSSTPALSFLSKEMKELACCSATH